MPPILMRIQAFYLPLHPTHTIYIPLSVERGRRRNSPLSSNVRGTGIQETCVQSEKQGLAAGRNGYGLWRIFPEHILDMKSPGLWIGMYVRGFMTNSTILIDFALPLRWGFPKMAIV